MQQRCCDRNQSLDADLTPKRPHNLVRLFWVLGLIAGVVVGAAVAFGIAGSEGPTPARVDLSSAA
jgi:hypothetical protein